MKSIREFFNKAGVKPLAVAIGFGAVTAVAAFNGAVGLAVVGAVVTTASAIGASGSALLDRFSNKPLF